MIFEAGCSEHARLQLSPVFEHGEWWHFISRDGASKLGCLRSCLAVALAQQ
eukprot:COSAG06_NODE_59505_length_274_cov_0.577143_1_plen_50_part_10